MAWSHRTSSATTPRRRRTRPPSWTACQTFSRGTRALRRTPPRRALKPSPKPEPRRRKRRPETEVAHVGPEAGGQVAAVGQAAIVEAGAADEDSDFDLSAVLLDDELDADELDLEELRESLQVTAEVESLNRAMGLAAHAESLAAPRAATRPRPRRRPRFFARRRLSRRVSSKSGSRRRSRGSRGRRNPAASIVASAPTGLQHSPTGISGRSRSTRATKVLWCRAAPTRCVLGRSCSSTAGIAELGDTVILHCHFAAKPGDARRGLGRSPSRAPSPSRMPMVSTAGV
jgi:hypothetical protein